MQANRETDLDKLEYGDDIIAVLDGCVNPIRLIYTGKTTCVVDDMTKTILTFTDAYSKPFNTEIFQIKIIYQISKEQQGR